jgi:hypothetical protein
MVAYAYSNCRTQDIIRTEIISQAKLENKDVAIVPDFYFTKLLSRKDAFDRFLGYNGFMAEYFKIKTIVFENYKFNYAALKNIDDFNLYETENKISDGFYPAQILLYKKDEMFGLFKPTIIVGIKNFMLQDFDVELFNKDILLAKLHFSKGLRYGNSIYFGSSEHDFPDQAVTSIQISAAGTAPGHFYLVKI